MLTIMVVTMVAIVVVARRILSMSKKWSYDMKKDKQRNNRRTKRQMTEYQHDKEDTGELEMGR